MTVSPTKAQNNQPKKKEKCWTFDNNISVIKMKAVLNVILYAIVGPILFYLLFLLMLHYKLNLTTEFTTEVHDRKPKFMIYARNNNTYYLKHVFAVLERLGFQQSHNISDWDLLWAHDYPFRLLDLKKLETHQRVNHFPGCGYITNKVDLSTSKGQYMLAAFKIPEDKDALAEYVKLNPQKTFVQKSNDHRGIKIQKVNELNFSMVGSFMQEFISKPYLIDGYKFDIGIYTAITSIDPLRVYIYKGDVLFRFCSVKYYPFDPENLDKYVVGDDYLPIWKVPSLKKYYTQLGFSMKDSFDAYVRSQGGEPNEVWQNAYNSIREVILMKEAQISNVLKTFQNKRNFFELVRFDFTLDEDLNVFVMEANMSPNLSSAHYPPNQLLYEQVLFNLFAMVGIGQRIKNDSLRVRSESEREMEVANKNLVVFPEICMNCEDCFQVQCQLCLPCFTTESTIILSQSYLEHQNMMDYERIFPPPITKDMILKDYTLRNQLLVRWYQGKCEIDPTWCN